MANIETITVGNITYDIMGGIAVSNEYSTTEKKVGTWIDGKPIYQKTINFGALPNNKTKTVNHEIANINNVISVKGVAVNLSTHETKPIPYTNIDNITYQIQLENVSRTLIDIRTKYNWSGLNAYVTLQYTKTTDV